MKKVEIFLDEITVHHNGNRDGEEDLVLTVEWEDRNFGDTDDPAAIDLENITSGDKKDLSALTGNDPKKKLKLRLFKSQLEGNSLMKFDLLLKKELSGFSKLLGKLFGAVVGHGVGTVTSGFANAISKKAAGEIIKFKDKWEYVLGEATILIEEPSLDSGSLEVKLEVDEKTEKALRRLYTRTSRAGHKHRAEEELDQEVKHFLESGEPNVILNLSIVIS